MNTSESLLFSARTARDQAGRVTTQLTITLAVMADIEDSVGDGEFTATSDITGITTVNLQYLLSLLRDFGYTAIVSGTDLITSW